MVKHVVYIGLNKDRASGSRYCEVQRMLSRTSAVDGSILRPFVSGGGGDGPEEMIGFNC